MALPVHVFRLNLDINTGWNAALVPCISDNYVNDR